MIYVSLSNVIGFHKLSIKEFDISYGDWHENISYLLNFGMEKRQWNVFLSLGIRRYF